MLCRTEEVWGICLTVYRSASSYFSPVPPNHDLSHVPYLVCVSHLLSPHLASSATLSLESEYTEKLPASLRMLFWGETERSNCSSFCFLCDERVQCTQMWTLSWSMSSSDSQFKRWKYHRVNLFCVQCEPSSDQPHFSQDLARAHIWFLRSGESRVKINVEHHTVMLTLAETPSSELGLSFQ